ncbi:MAG: isochorismatase family protein [Haloarculaceae archaeon]
MADRESIYRAADMGEQRVGYGDWPGIVAVDLQYGETDENHPMGSDLSAVIEQNNRLVDAAHEKGVPVFWTRVIYRHPEAADAGLWTEKVPLIAEWQPGTRWVEIDDRCHVTDGDHVLDKRHASSFHETELDSMLTAMGCDTVIVTGCSTSACVRSTVDDASAHGYHAIVPETCVGDRSDEQHEAHLWDLDRKFADVEPTVAVLEYLQGLPPKSER